MKAYLKTKNGINSTYEVVKILGKSTCFLQKKFDDKYVKADKYLVDFEGRIIEALDDDIFIISEEG